MYMPAPLRVLGCTFLFQNGTFSFVKSGHIIIVPMNVMNFALTLLALVQGLMIHLLCRVRPVIAFRTCLDTLIFPLSTSSQCLYQLVMSNSIEGVMSVLCCVLCAENFGVESYFHVSQILVNPFCYTVISWPIVRLLKLS